QITIYTYSSLFGSTVLTFTDHLSRVRIVKANTLLLNLFFQVTATTYIYTLSLHDALPICAIAQGRGIRQFFLASLFDDAVELLQDRKSTRLNSSHSQISYAVFCLKKKNRRIAHRLLPIIPQLRIIVVPR